LVKPQPLSSPAHAARLTLQAWLTTEHVSLARIAAVSSGSAGERSDGS
jgi:hypothetical protein